jgi:serine/threonine protein phosphatase PrpC
MKITDNLFDLTPEQIASSKMMYSGKVVKCLVAPYHTFAQLEKVVKYTKNTYLFPERELSVSQIRGLISMIAANQSNEEFRIITTNQNVILDMIDSCVRVLTEEGDVVDCPCKTFAANIHDIRYYILENEAHQISTSQKQQSKDAINLIIQECQANAHKKMLKADYDILAGKVESIGEDVIRGILEGHLQDIEVI